MSWVTEILDQLAALPAPLVLAVAGVLAFAETAVGFGLVLPGETGVLVMATTVDTRPEFALMTLVVWLSASAGDSFGYWIGRRYGYRVRQSRLVARAGTRHWDRTADLLRRRGGLAVVGARFLPGVRALAPVAAGASHMSYPRFVGASLAGALVWSAVHVAAGAFAGASLHWVERVLGTGGWLVLGLLAMVVVALVVRHRRRRDRADADEPAQVPARARV
jgi:membrane-associated protein